MGLWSRVKRWFGGTPRATESARRPVRRSTYDAAADGEDNRRHWLNADALSAKFANTLKVRKALRERARYETANNGYFQGLNLTLANDVIGTGPSLQCLIDTGNPEADRAANKQIETAFAAWWEAAGLTEKLHTAKQSKTRDGEAFALMHRDEAMAPVQLNVQLIECDRVTHPNVQATLDPSISDGIEYDDRGRVVRYLVLDEHPGDYLLWSYQFTNVAPRDMIHWYRVDRPGQLRGVPEFTSSLSLGAIMRRWTMATITAAETAANFAAVLETEAPGDEEEPEVDPETGNAIVNKAGDTIEIERNQMLTLPGGAKLNQLEAKHPGQTYDMAKREFLKELGRPVNAPYCISAGDSSPYNFSSVRVDRTLLYIPAIKVEREQCRRVFLERVFFAWIEEAALIPGVLPALPPNMTATSIPRTWYWPGFASYDPLKDAQAETEQLNNCTTTLAELAAEKNKDWEDLIAQRGREVQMKKGAGIPEVAPNGGLAANDPAADPQNANALFHRNGHAG